MDLFSASFLQNRCYLLGLIPTQNTDTSSSKFCEISQSPLYSTHTKPLLHSSTTTHKCLEIFFFLLFQINNRVVMNYIPSNGNAAMV